MLLHFYQVTWYPVPDTCTLDTHNNEKQNRTYVNTLIYKQQFHQLNLQDMRQWRIQLFLSSVYGQ